MVVIEPSDAVMIQHDYRDLLPRDKPDELSGTVAAGGGGEGPADVEVVADDTYGVLEYLDRHRLDESLTYHGHYRQKSTKKDHHAVGVLRRASYDVDPLDSGCCGMAGPLATRPNTTR